MKTTKTMRWVSGLWCGAALAFSALGAKTTQTTAAGDWSDAIWDAGAPAAGDTVIVAHPIALTNATPALASYTLNAGVTHTLATTNALLRADDVVIEGILAHQVHSRNITTNSVGQWIIQHGINIACGNLTVTQNGKIDAYAKGFLGAPARTNAPGLGPGGGRWIGQIGGHGGGHGGLGGGTGGGMVYGVPEIPVWPGSGGGCTKDDGNAYAGAGGGLIRIVATGTVTIDGEVTADGEFLTSPKSLRGAGGSGGGIYIACNVLSGNGRVSANGGWGRSSAAGGGGGRVAVHCSSAAQRAATRPQVRFSMGGRSGASSSKGTGEDGTLYVSDARLLPETWNDNARIYMQRVWSADSLSLSNATLRLMDPGAEVTVAGAMTMRSSVGGASAFYIAAAPFTNAVLNVGGTLQLADNAWIYPLLSVNTDTNCIGVHLRAGTLTIGTTAGVNADYAGWKGASYDSVGGLWNEKNGFGIGGGAYDGGGGGHGGTGGRATATYGISYGDANAPAQPGSGGAAGATYTGQKRFGGNGGGLIHIEVERTFTLDGKLLANGYAGTFSSGGGSGGGIHVRCSMFTGADSMIVSANGGNGGNYENSSGGGGGRIAIWRTTDTKAGGTFTANGGTGLGGTSHPPGTIGTIVWGSIPPRGTVIALR